MTAQDERAAVVAWLRKLADYELASPGKHGAHFSAAFFDAADAIERGDHITPGGD